MANEKKEDPWVENILRPKLAKELSNEYEVNCKQHLLYALNIKSYCKNGYGQTKANFYTTDIKPKDNSYEIDLLISQKINDFEFIPLIAIETKWGKMTTHDIITYNKKAEDHKKIHKNLLYGVVVANYTKGGLTIQKLYRHQFENFDFVFCFKGKEPTTDEWQCFVDLIKRKITESQNLHTLLARDKKGRDSFICLEKTITCKEN